MNEKIDFLMFHMIKKWLVKCEINMDAQKKIEVLVTANTERKAKDLAIKQCYNNLACSIVTVISCMEIKE